MVTVYLTAEDFLSLATFIKKAAKKIKLFKINSKNFCFFTKSLKVASEWNNVKPLYRGIHAYPSKESAT